MTINYPIEIAARAPVECLGEQNYTAAMDVRGGKEKDVTYIRYRFDTRSIYGDYMIVEIPAPFASEESARAALYNEIRTF